MRVIARSSLYRGAHLVGNVYVRATSQLSVAMHCRRGSSVLPLTSSTGTWKSGPIAHIRTHPFVFSAISCLFLKTFLPDRVSRPAIGHTDRGLAAPRGLAALRSGQRGEVMLCICPTNVCHFLPQHLPYAHLQPLYIEPCLT